MTVSRSLYAFLFAHVATTADGEQSNKACADQPIPTGFFYFGLTVLLTFARGKQWLFYQKSAPAPASGKGVMSV